MIFSEYAAWAGGHISGPKPRHNLPPEGLEMKKICLLFVTAALLLGTLTGCFRTVDELFTLPKLPEEYQNLQEKIEEFKADGCELFL